MSFSTFLKIAVGQLKEQVIIDENTVIERAGSVQDENVKLAEIVANAVGFSYQLIIFSETLVGDRLSNGSWTGALGMLQRHEVDMVISNVGVGEQRNRDFLFSDPYGFGEITYVARKHGYSREMDLFLHPFSTDVWILVITCICTMPFVFGALAHKKCDLSTNFILTVCSLLRQPTKLLPQKLEEYILHTAWLLCCTLLGYFYSVVLLSFLSFPSLDGIHTVKDLAVSIKEGKYYCSSILGNYLESEFTHSGNPDLEVIGKSLQQGGHFANFVEFLEDYTDVRKPVFIGIREHFMPFKNYYYVSEENFFSGFAAIAVRKDFCCKSELDKVVSRMRAGGIIQKIGSNSYYKLLYRMQNALTFKNYGSQSKLSMIVFKGPFIFLMASHAFATFLFFLELLLGKAKRRSPKLTID